MERSDTHGMRRWALDCFAALAMTRFVIASAAKQSSGASALPSFFAAEEKPLDSRLRGNDYKDIPTKSIHGQYAACGMEVIKPGMRTACL